MIKIFGQKGCSYCSSATLLLDTLGKEYEYHDVQMSNEAFAEMKTYTPNSWSTVPVVVIDGKFIGGYNELSRYKFDS